MIDDKERMLNLIRYKKLKGSIRKPKYATRKLSIGLVSCLLGFSLIFGANDAWASEISNSEPSQEDKVKQGENQEKDLDSLKEEAKVKIEAEIKDKDKNQESEKSKTLLSEYKEKIDKVENKEDLDLLLADFEKAIGIENNLQEEKKEEKEASGLRSANDGEEIGVSPEEEKENLTSPNPDASEEKETKKEEIKENWDSKPVDKSRWAIEDDQKLVRVSSSDPVQMNDIDYDGSFVDAKGNTNIRLIYKEKSQSMSVVWHKSLINFGDLEDKIDFDKSYVVGKDGKNYPLTKVEQGHGYIFDLAKAAGNRTDNRTNLPINLVLKDGKTIADLGKKNYTIQMRVTDDDVQRIYAYAPGNTSLDYSTYTKTTSIDLDDNVKSLFMKGGLQNDSENVTNQEFFMSEFIANPKYYADSSNLGIIRTQYMGLRAGTEDSPKVGGENVAYTQVFDANLVNYLKEDGQGNIAYVNLMTVARVDSPYAKNFAIKKSMINYSADGKLAYLVIAPEGYKKEGVKVVTIPKHDQYTMLQGFYITAIDYVVDKAKFADTFDKGHTKKLDYSMMAGWTNPNEKGWTTYESGESSGYVARAGESYFVDTTQAPEGGQIMIKIGDSDQAIIRKGQGYYNGSVIAKGAIDKIEQISPGVFKFTLREGATLKAGDKIKVYMPYSEKHESKVRFLSISNGTERNEGAATLSIDKDRSLLMHIYRDDKASYKLTYTPKGSSTTKEITFKPNAINTGWLESDYSMIVGLPNRGKTKALGNFKIDTRKIEPGTDIVVDVYDANGNKIEGQSSYLTYTDLTKIESYKGISWVDHSYTQSVLSINKSLYKPYQEIFTNDTVADSTDDTYKDPRKLVSEEDFKKDTTKIDGYTKYDGGKIRVEFKDGKTPKIVKTEADSNDYDDNGNIKGNDKRVGIQLEKNGKTYNVYKYEMDLNEATSARSADSGAQTVAGTAPKLYKDMKLVFNASDGSSLPSDDVIARVRTRILFNATDGEIEGKKSVIRIAPDNKKFFGEDGYVASGFRGENVEEGTGDAFVSDPTTNNSKLKFLGWVTEAGKNKLGSTKVKAADFKKLDGEEIFTADTPIIRHQIVYAIWAEEQVVKFDANGGQFDDGKREEVNVIPDEGGTTAPKAPTKEGKKFAGWTKEDGTPVSDEEIKNLDGTTKLIAKWEDKTPEEQAKDETPPASPSITEPEDGNVKIAPPSDDDTKTVDVSYTDKDGNPKTITASKDDDGKWTLPDDAPTGSKIDPNTGVITLPTSEIKGDTDVTANAKDGSNNSSDGASQKVAYKDKYSPDAPDATKVDDPTNLSQTEKDEIKNKVRDKNPSLPPDANIEVEKDGNVTIKYKDGSEDKSITKDKTVVKKTDAEKYTPANPTDKVKINKAGALSGDEKDKVKKAVEEANNFPEGTDVRVENDGEVIITYPDKTIDKIPGKDTVDEKTLAEKVDPNLPVITKVENPANLSQEEKNAVKKAIEDKNDFPRGTEIEVGDDGEVTIKYSDGSTDTIKKDKTVAEDTVLKITNPTKVKVSDTDTVTPEDQGKIKEAIKTANPSLNLTDEQITVDNKGNVTITVGNKVAKLDPADTIEEDKKLLVKDPTLTPVDNLNELSQDDKDKVKQAIKDANPSLSETAKIDFNDDGSVTITDGGKTATIDKGKLVKAKTDAEKNPLRDPEKTKVNNQFDLTKEEQDAVKKAIKEANRDKNLTDEQITVDGKGNVTVKFNDGSKIEILGKNTVEKKPDNERVKLTDPTKTSVDNPSELTQDEQNAVKKAVEDANNLPNNTKVSVDYKGKVTIEYPDGSKAEIEPKKTVEAEIKDPARTIVIDKNSLTEDEKAAIKKEILKANPSLRANDVSVDENGKVTITKTDGTQKEINPENTISAVKVPDITVVGDANKLTEQEIADIKKKFENVNKTIGATFEVKEDGSVEAHKNDLTTTIPAEKVVKSSIKNPEKTLVSDPANLSDDEKQAIKEAVKKANPSVKEKDINVGDDGKVTIGKGDDAKIIPADKVIRTDVKAPIKTPVKDPNSISKAEKDAIKDAIKKANPDLADADITINDDGSANVYKEGETTKIIADQTTTPAIKNPDPTIVKDTDKLSDDDKAKIKEAVKLANKDLSDDQITVNKDGSVTIRKEGEIPQTIPADKTVVGDVKAPELTKVNDPNNLSETDKKNIKDAIKTANPNLTNDEDIIVNDDGSVTIKTAGKEIEIPSEKTIKSNITNPETTIVNDDENLTDHEKSTVEDLVRMANPDLPEGSTIEVASDGKVTIKNKEGNLIATIPADKTVSESFNAPDRTLVQYPNNLKDKEKEDVREAIKKANSGLRDDQIEVMPDGCVKITDSKGKVSIIPGSNTVGAEVRQPELTIVKDKNKLTPAEKDQVIKAVIKANPELTPEQITVNDNGSGVVRVHGKELFYPSERVVREDVKAPELTEVDDFNKLTDDDRTKVKDAVKEANPDINPNNIKVNGDGSVTISKDGKEVTIPAVQTITSAIKNPAPTRVNDPSSLTKDDKEKIKEAIKKANKSLPAGTEITVDNEGNAKFTVAGKEHLIPSSATLAENAKLPTDKTKVFEKNNLNTDEIEKIRNAIETANKFDLGTQVVVEANGQVTINYPDKSKETISIDELVVVKAKPNLPAKTKVQDPNKLSPAEQKAVKQAIEGANTGKGFKVEVDENGKATITYPDNTQVQIDAKELVEKKTTDTNPANPGIDPTNSGSDYDNDTSLENGGDDHKSSDENSDTSDDKESDKDDDKKSDKDEDKKDSANEKSDDKAESDKENTKALIPEAKIPVKDAENLTDEEKARVAENVKKANPDAINVKVDDKGNASLEYADKSEESIPAKNLIYKENQASVAVPSRNKKENAGLLRNKDYEDLAPARVKKSANVKTGIGSINGILLTLGTAISGLIATKKKEDK